MIFNKILILILMVLINTISTMGQDLWEAGFVITQKADTVFGLIENNDIRANIQFCNFRKTMIDPVIKYEPQDIRGYRFNDGKFYISKSIDDSEFDGPVFMEYLIQGQANIYRYVNERYFIETVDGIQELKNSEELVEYKGDKYINLKKEYILLLNYFMREANMPNQIQAVRFNSKSLISIAKRFHERVCDDEECIVYEKSVSNMRWRYRISGGLSFNSYNFGAISDTNFGLGGFGGLGLELRRFSPWVEKFSVSLDVLLSRQANFSIRAVSDDIGVPITYEGEYFILTKDRIATFIGNNNALAPIFSTSDVTINALTLRMPLVVNFYFSKGKLAPYVGLGGVVALQLNYNEDFIYHYYLDNLGTSVPDSNFGGVARLGVTYRMKNEKEVAFEANLERTRSSNHNRSLRLQRQTFTFGMIFSL